MRTRDPVGLDADGVVRGPGGDDDDVTPIGDPDDDEDWGDDDDDDDDDDEEPLQVRGPAVEYRDAAMQHDSSKSGMINPLR
jgi:hypothetical protein